MMRKREHQGAENAAAKLAIIHHGHEEEIGQEEGMDSARPMRSDCLSRFPMLSRFSDRRAIVHN